MKAVGERAEVAGAHAVTGGLKLTAAGFAGLALPPERVHLALLDL